MSVPQGQNDARRAFIVADTTDVTAKKVYVVDPVVAAPNARRLYAVTPADPTAIRVWEVTAGTPGAVPVYYVDANGAPASTYLHRSTFTAPDGTALSAYVPEVGNAWTALVGTWTINGNAATSGTTTGQAASTPMGASDLIVAATLRYSATARNLGLAIRASDASNMWVAYLTNTTIALYEMVATALTLKVSATVPAGAINTDYRMAVRANGPTIDVYLDGTQRLTWPSATSNQVIQKHGMFISGGISTQSIPDVLAYPVTANPATA